MPTVFSGALARALRLALDAVPAGGLVLEAEWDGAGAAAAWLRARRGDRVLLAAARGPADFRARPDALPLEDRSVLAALSLQTLPAQEDPRGPAAALAELARVARRYLVLGSLHPLSLGGRRHSPGSRRLPHHKVEALARAQGFRLLARAADRAFLQPGWAYVFARG